MDRSGDEGEDVPAEGVVVEVEAGRVAHVVLAAERRRRLTLEQRAGLYLGVEGESERESARGEEG